jgi:hypothetical protein
MAAIVGVAVSFLALGVSYMAWRAAKRNHDSHMSVVFDRNWIQDGDGWSVELELVNDGHAAAVGIEVDLRPAGNYAKYVQAVTDVVRTRKINPGNTKPVRLHGKTPRPPDRCYTFIKWQDMNGKKTKLSRYEIRPPAKTDPPVSELVARSR